MKTRRAVDDVCDVKEEARKLFLGFLAVSLVFFINTICFWLRDDIHEIADVPHSSASSRSG